MCRQAPRAGVLRAGHLVGDGHGRQFHHRAHAGHRQDGRLVAYFEDVTDETRRRFQRGVQHVGHVDIDAEDGGPGALGLGIEPRQRLADQTEVRRVLQSRRGIERQARRRLGRELTIGQPVAAAIDDESFLATTLGRIDPPALRRRPGQYLTCRSTCLSQAAVERRRRHRRSLLLYRRLVLEGDLVGVASGDETDRDALPVGVELVGQDLRQRRIGALAHFRLRQTERDLTVWRDRDPIGNFAGTKLGSHRKWQRHQQAGRPDKCTASR